MGQAVGVEPHLTAKDAADALLRDRYDQAPVLVGDRPVGFVLTRRLELHDGIVADLMTALGSGNVVSADASIGSLLEWIIEPGFLFVVDGRKVSGFITVSDFNKQAARAYLYVLLATLEMGLAEVVRRHYGPQQDATLYHLPEGRRVAVASRFADDQAAGEEGDLVTYFDFSDLVTVIGKDEALLYEGRT